MLLGSEKTTNNTLKFVPAKNTASFASPLAKASVVLIKWNNIGFRYGYCNFRVRSFLSIDWDFRLTGTKIQEME